MKKWDIALIGGLLAIALVLFAVSALTRKTGEYVVVRVNGEEVARYDLEQDGIYPLNGGSNILRIENGKAYLTEADCPDLLCVKQGEISYDGQTITCLPNRLTVTVFGKTDSSVDVVSG